MIIYKTINLTNGKIYVGQDSRGRPKYLGSGVALKGAIKKYGEENFKKEMVAWCYAKEHLDFLERFYIIFLNSKFPNGYNLTDGGDGAIGLRCSGETRIKLSKSRIGKPSGMLGKHHSKKTREKMSRSKKGKNIGICFSEEHRKHMNESHIGNIPWNKGRTGGTFSEEARKNISKGIKLWWKNRKEEK